MKTINLFVNSFPKNSETFIYNKVSMLLKNGFTVNVIASEIDLNSNLNISDLKSNKSFRIITNPLKLRFTINIFLRAIFSKSFWIELQTNNGNIRKSYKDFILLSTLRKFSPDIIHFEFSGLGFQYLHLFKKLSGITLVSSFRGAAENITPIVNSKRRLEFPYFLDEIDFCHCVSKKMALTLGKYGLDRSKVFINYPSIDIDKFRFIEEYNFNSNYKIRIISVGRLHWKKGIDIAILALRKLKEKGFNFTYTIVGDGTEYEKLKFLTSNFELENEIEFVGYKSPKEVSELLSKSHLFLLPSYSEGLANSVLEAMSTGIPVVSARAGGLEEAINHMESGFLFNVGDVNGLYSSLLSLFKHSYDLNAIRKNARQTIENKFDIHSQSDKFKNLYQNI
jgi:colanic acid/amylovoran biosynthesis glycosyltransferase